MRYKQIIWSVLLVLFIIPCTSSAQNGLKRKADKHYQIHNYKDAIKNYLRYINRNRNSTNSQGRLADCYRHLNQLEEAAKWYEQVVHQPDVNPEFLFQYGQTLKSLGRYEDARKWFLTYAEKHPEKGIHYAESCQYALEKQGSPAGYKINAEFTNTEAADFAPAFYKDQLVFASSRMDFNNNKKKRDEVNWPFITQRDQNNYLLKPALLHQRFKVGNEGPFSYSEDGRWVAVTRNNFVNGVRQIPSSGFNLNIQIAEILPNGEWQNEKYFPYNGSNFSTAYPSFSPDGKSLYFASNRPDGFGGFDIFVSYKVGNTWTTPENLGPTVNTQGNEITPFFDGQDLFFASDWHKGMGGLDIFRAAKTGGSWDRVYHLDTEINSSADDYGFIYDKTKDLGYFVSNRKGGKGNEDIYRISKVSDNLEIVVLDRYSMQPIADADIDFASCGQPTFKTDAKGRHVLQVPPGLQCQAVIRKTGYLSSYLNVSANDLGGAQSLRVLLDRTNSTSTNTPTNPTTQPNAQDRFIGQIYDINTGRDVVSVHVSALNQQTGKKLETITDARGNYTLSLEPYNTYLITYTKAGYSVTSRSVVLGNGQDKNILGSYPIRMIRGGTVVDNGGTTNPNTNGNTTTNPTNPNNGGGGTHPYVDAGFSVQVAAFRSSSNSDLSRFKTLGSVGNVYNRYEGNKTKVRVGVFPTRAAAVEATKTIKNQGFGDCFVVSESMEGLGQDIVISDEITINNTTKPTNPTTTATVDYKVRLAAYKNPEYFPRTKVEGIGQVESRTKGPWTIMLLAGYTNLGDAQRAANSARQAGFPQAHVVMDNGGELTKVK